MRMQRRGTGNPKGERRQAQYSNTSCDKADHSYCAGSLSYIYQNEGFLVGCEPFLGCYKPLRLCRRPKPSIPFTTMTERLVNIYPEGYRANTCVYCALPGQRSAPESSFSVGMYPTQMSCSASHPVSLRSFSPSSHQ